MANTSQTIELVEPIVAANGFNTNQPANFGSTVAVTGAVTLSGAISSAGVITSKSGTAATAGGVQQLQFGSTSGLGIYTGSGAPTASAAVGSIYLRTDGTTTLNTVYVNLSGATTWVSIN